MDPSEVEDISEEVVELEKKSLLDEDEVGCSMQLVSTDDEYASAP